MQEFISISLLIMLAAISPGPDFAVVTKNSLMYSRKAGLFTALGVAVSILIHASYCILGLAIIISQSLIMFKIIKYAGAAYLIYLGVKGLLAKRDTQTIDVQHLKRQVTASQMFYEGLLCNLLNPKAILFLLAFFTLVIKPTNSLFIEIGYSLEIAAITMVWFSTLSYLLTHSSVKEYLSRVQYYIVKAMGALLVAFGVRIATLSI